MGVIKATNRGYSLHFDPIEGYKGKGLFGKQKGLLWYSLGYDYTYRRIRNRRYLYSISAHWRRYPLVQRIFLRRYIKEQEFMRKLEVECIVRLRVNNYKKNSSSTGSVDRRSIIGDDRKRN